MLSTRTVTVTSSTGVSVIGSTAAPGAGRGIAGSPRPGRRPHTRRPASAAVKQDPTGIPRKPRTHSTRVIRSRHHEIVIGICPSPRDRHRQATQDLPDIHRSRSKAHLLPATPHRSCRTADQAVSTGLAPMTIGPAQARCRRQPAAPGRRGDRHDTPRPRTHGTPPSPRREHPHPCDRGLLRRHGARSLGRS